MFKLRRFIRNLDWFYLRFFKKQNCFWKFNYSKLVVEIKNKEIEASSLFSENFISFLEKIVWVIFKMNLRYFLYYLTNQEFKIYTLENKKRKSILNKIFKYKEDYYFHPMIISKTKQQINIDLLINFINTSPIIYLEIENIRIGEFQNHEIEIEENFSSWVITINQIKIEIPFSSVRVMLPLEDNEVFFIRVVGNGSYFILKFIAKEKLYQF